MPIEGSHLEDQDSDEVVSVQQGVPEPDWVAIAREAYATSTSYLDANYRKQLEKNLSNFKGKHPQGSKYHTDAYKYRSKLFRPKTRSATWKNEAALAMAMFSTAEAVEVEAEDKNNPQSVVDADFMGRILNYRLKKTIPWFKIAIGGMQDAQINGAVISKQFWNQQVSVDDQGQQAVVKNEPEIKIIPFENFRFDPAADWLNPVKSSPYIIEVIPMYVGDILDYMLAVDPETNEPLWISYSKDEILSTKKSNEDDGASTRSTRESGHSDPQAANQGRVGDFDLVMVHENCVRYDGKEYVYHTLGTEKLLSRPRLLAESYPLGRPYRIGVCVIEAHRVIPAGTVELTQDLQAAANNLVNQRQDNVNLVLNKRKFVSRTANVDYAALKRSVPGGIVLMNDAKTSVVPEEIPDITSAAYQEQDRLNADFDDLAGSFSTSSVATNRKLNETVGGMQMISGMANALTEFLLRTLVETWIEPVLQDIVSLEQLYETDEFKQRFVLEGQAPSQQPEKMDVSVSVGFGSMDSNQKIERLYSAIKAIAEVMPWLLGKLDGEQFVKEVFGAIGYRNGKRFFRDFEPPEQQANPELELKIQELQLKAKELEQTGQLEQLRIQATLELGYAKLALEENVTMAELEAKLGIETEKIKTQRDVEGVKAMNFQNELAFKNSSGREGI